MHLQVNQLLTTQEQDGWLMVVKVYIDIKSKCWVFLYLNMNFIVTIDFNGVFYHVNTMFKVFNHIKTIFRAFLLVNNKFSVIVHLNKKYTVFFHTNTNIKVFFDINTNIKALFDTSTNINVLFDTNMNLCIPSTKHYILASISCTH